MIYYFGHGGVQYLEVDNEEEEAMMPKIADRLNSYNTEPVLDLSFSGCKVNFVFCYLVFKFVV